MSRPTAPEAWKKVGQFLQPQPNNELISTPRVLHLEDNPLDRELIRCLLGEADIRCRITAVQTRAEFERSLVNEAWDLILSDYALPSFDGYSALKIAGEVCPNTPFIFVTGTMGEDIAVETLKHGATDYVLKQKLSRLDSAVRRALQERAERLRRQEAEAELRKSEEQIRFLAYHDALTGLPNRAYLQVRLQNILADARRHKERAALLFLDLDGFKHINDSLGHSVGDLVLKEVANRIQGCTRVPDIVARLGGDEFIVVLSRVGKSTDAADVADRIRRTITGEIAIDGHILSVTSSIGISVFPDDGSESEALIKNADAALFCAKDQGRNGWQFFTPAMNVQAVEHVQLESGLRRALDLNQLFLEYQPQVQLATGKIIGVEALLRWQHPELGLVPPKTFVPVAESIGEIVRIGEWVLRTACSQARQWQDEGIPPLVMAVNVSASQLREGSLQKIIEDVLNETRLRPQQLELEITESLLLNRSDEITSQMRAFREMGLRLALDDFGAGYSSFAYMRRFRFDRLKIDGSFVQELNVDPDDAEITAAIIGIGSILRMDVMAECVETREQLSTLRSLGCDRVQGFYFSRPLSASTITQKLQSAPKSLVGTV
jgi:diguanylate cyclase